MKKNKIGIMLFVVFLLSSGMRYEAQAEEGIAKGGTDAGYGKAAYATECPEIDGKADDIWSTTEALNSNEGEGEATGYVKVLWTEDTLYLLARIEDTSLELSKEHSTINCINFWVSETVSQESGYNNSGDWCLSVNADGDVWCPVGNKSVLQQVTCSVQKETKAYTVELEVPVMTEGRTYKEADGIGFNISIDDDVDGDEVRDGFRSWQKYSNDVWYWENTEDLAIVEFVKQTEDVTSEEDMSLEEGADRNTMNQEEEQIEVWQIIVAVSCVAILCAVIIWHVKTRKKDRNIT